MSPRSRRRLSIELPQLRKFARVDHGPAVRSGLGDTICDWLILVPVTPSSDVTGTG